jgi:hypothetical protein
MRKLKLSTGLHQYTVADLEHLSDMVFEVGSFFGDLFTDATTSGKAVIVSGCHWYVNPTNSQQMLCAPGWLVIAGELYRFDGKSLNVLDYTLGEYQPYFTITETFRSDNPIIYGNGTLKNVHAIRKVLMGFTNGGYGGIDPATLTVPNGSYAWQAASGATYGAASVVVYGMDVLTARLKERVGATSWQAVGITAGAATWFNGFKNGTHNTFAYQNVRYCKDIAEGVWIQGFLNLECVSALFGASLTGGSAKNIFRLPAGMRPQLRQEFSIPIQTWDGWATGLFAVNVDGWVTLQFTAQQVGVTNNSFDGDTDSEIKFHYSALM